MDVSKMLEISEAQKRKLKNKIKKLENDCREKDIEITELKDKLMNWKELLAK